MNHCVCAFICPYIHVSRFCQDLLNLSTIFKQIGVVIYYHEMECHAEKSVGYLEGQAHSEALYNQNRTVSTISSKLLVRLGPNLVC